MIKMEKIMLNFTPIMGRLEHPDARDTLFSVSAVLPAADPFITEKYWWDDAWWGNQGATEECTAYSWMHWIENGPVFQDDIPGRTKPFYQPIDFYNQCQQRDPWAGTPHNGSSVRTAVRLLKILGVIKEYRWATNVEDVAQTLINLGPMIVGTSWFSNMFTPDANGLIKPTGSNAGGHAYLLNGVDLKKRLFRIKNSWGQEWGVNGHAFIGFDDFQFLLNNGGESCIAFENKLAAIPSFDVLPPPGRSNDG
jgi:hypothetical protein